ncbi:MAG: cellulase family glycosylhydrolase [Spirochaetes bacterium]|nr:cellulase family glycosylhydrolase [Spirochaetota bacterium]
MIRHIKKPLYPVCALFSFFFIMMDPSFTDAADSSAQDGLLKGFSISGGVLTDGMGNPFIMRGINYPHAWFQSKLTSSLKQISSYGANTVRVVLSNGVRWNRTGESEIREIISECRKNRLIAVLEVHDTTGYGWEKEACTLEEAVSYWISVKESLIGAEDYVIINIGNEPNGGIISGRRWVRENSDAVKKMREAGLCHTIMIDAPDWGQDSRKIMLKNAPKVFTSDPLKNVMFSVHMYQKYGKRAKIDRYLSTFVKNRLCLIVGEFGADHQGHPVDEASILELCEIYKTGYLGWSWSGNSKEVADLDIITDWNPENLSPWGRTLIQSEYGISRTSKVCTVFSPGK